MQRLQVFEQRRGLVVAECVQIQQRRADAIADAVVFPFQVFDRIDLRHSRHQNAAAVCTLLGKIGDIDILVLARDTLAQPRIVFCSGVAEIPVAERIVGRVAKEIPADHTARIDEVNFEVRWKRNLFHVEAWLRKPF